MCILNVLLCNQYVLKIKNINCMCVIAYINGLNKYTTFSARKRLSRNGPYDPLYVQVFLIE